MADEDFERDEYFDADAEDRRAALAAAVMVESQFTGAVHRADIFYNWLRARPSIVPARIVVGNPTIAPQDNPSAGVPAPPRGAGMAVVMKDSQVATYPPAEAVDAKGFPVPGDMISVSEDSAGAVVALVVADGSDPALPAGSAVLTAVAPGNAQVTWTDGTNSFVDGVNVTAGDVVGIQVGAAVITDQAPAGP